MRKLFRLSMGLTRLPKELKRVWSLVPGDKLYLYKREGVYSLGPQKKEDGQLIHTMKTELADNLYLKIKLPDDIVNELSWNGTLFLYYDLDGNCNLEHAKPYCSMCEKITCLSDLIKKDNGEYYCKTCNAGLKKVLDKEPWIDRLERKTLSDSDVIESKYKLVFNQYPLSDSYIEHNIFELENEDSSVRIISGKLQEAALALELGGEIPVKDLEMLKIYSKLWIYAIANKFYSMGKGFKILIKEERNMIDYTCLISHSNRGRLITSGGIKFESVEDKNWFGFDLSEKPIAICLRDLNNQLILYSTKLYQFKNRNEARTFCEKLRDEQKVEEFQKELLEHRNTLNKMLEEKVNNELESFDELLEQHSLDKKQFFEILQEFTKLPSYLKTVLREQAKEK